MLGEGMEYFVSFFKLLSANWWWAAYPCIIGAFVAVVWIIADLIKTEIDQWSG